MKTKVEKPNILRFSYFQEPEDKGYGSCLYAHFDFDLELWMLNIQSDVGNYAYCWPAWSNGAFLKLMANIGEDYLIHKLCKEAVVDIDCTIEDLKEALDDNGFGEEEAEEALEELREKLEDSSADHCIGLAQMIVEEWNEDQDFCLDCAYEYVAIDFSPWQKRIVDIFINHIQPEIIRFLKEANPQ